MPAGGAGIVLGLATFGYKILRVLGVDAVKISNSRGFCAELATAITVVLASRVGVSRSTTRVPFTILTITFLLQFILPTPSIHENYGTVTCE